MKTDLDWRVFFEALDRYAMLPVSARKFLVDEVKPSQPVAKSAVSHEREAFLTSGLLLPGPTGVNLKVPERYRDFLRALRTMRRSRVFEQPARQSFQAYLNDTLTTSEASSIQGRERVYWGYSSGYPDIFPVVCASAWPKQFLAATDREWEAGYIDKSQPPYFYSSELMKAAQSMAALLVEEQKPTRLARLHAAARQPDENFGPALRALLRYLLVFVALDSATLEPVVGLWPGLARRLSGKPVPAPAPVNVTAEFRAPFVMEDLMAILSSCAAQPVRLRSNDRRIFESSIETLSQALAGLPSWIEQTLQFDAGTRIEFAMGFAMSHRFVKPAGRPGADYRLDVTEAGAHWLSLSAKERLRALLDGVREPPRDRGFDDAIPLIPGLNMYDRRDEEKIRRALFGAFAGLPENIFFRGNEFADFQCAAGNPLTELARKDRYFRSGFSGEPQEEEIEGAWRGAVTSFMLTRLLPLGGIALGAEDKSPQLSFAMTDAGRYIVGAAHDFELPAEGDVNILVQPNFDVVFLTPSVAMEAEISRFAERTGRHVGTLFRITKNSILQAAAAGLSSEYVLETLRERCPSGIPSNVEREIAGWFKRYRRVDVRPAVIAHCPDAETASHLLALLGKNAQRISETTLELESAKFSSAIGRKLRDAGIFIRT